jgi:hypothetical protein
LNKVATVQWNGHSAWNFMQREKVLECWASTGDNEPKRLFAWHLEVPDNFIQVLLVTLQKFHAMDKQNLSSVVFAIIAVQNAFARTIAPMPIRDIIYDTEDSVS